MAVVILEGKITELSNGVVSGGQITEYAYVTIGGKRVRRVVAALFMDSFVKVGAVVRLACVKSAGRHIVFAVQESNGEISKEDLGPLLFKLALFALCSVVLGAIAALFTFIFTQSLFITGCAFIAVLTGLPYLAFASYFKARNALDGMAAPVEPAVA